MAIPKIRAGNDITHNWAIERKGAPEDLTKIEQLEAENAQLRMENEFLKKLDALVQQRKKQPKKN